MLRKDASLIPLLSPCRVHWTFLYERKGENTVVQVDAAAKFKATRYLAARKNVPNVLMNSSSHLPLISWHFSGQGKDIEHHLLLLLDCSPGSLRTHDHSDAKCIV